MKTSLDRVLLPLVALPLFASSDVSAQSCHSIGPGCVPTPPHYTWLWVGAPGHNWGHPLPPSGDHIDWALGEGQGVCSTCPPNTTLDDVYINQDMSTGGYQGTQAAVMAKGDHYTVGRLNVGGTSGLVLQPGSSIRIASAAAPNGQIWGDSGTARNHGFINVHSDASNDSYFWIGTGPRGGVNLTGAHVGGINLAGPRSYLGADKGNAGLLLWNYEGHAIRGYGSIGGGHPDFQPQPVALLNDGGIIDADDPNGGALTVVLNDMAGANVTNQAGGILRASNNGTLYFTAPGGTTGKIMNDLNANTRIVARDNGKVWFNQRVTVENAQFFTEGNGTIRGDFLLHPYNGGGIFAGARNYGTMAIAANESIQLRGQFLNYGTLRMDAVPNQNPATLTLHHNTTLGGNGSITLSNSGLNHINGASDGVNVTLAPGATLQGGGIFNNGHGVGIGMMTLVNQGLIDANQPAWILFRLSSGRNALLSNSGIIRASNGSTFLFDAHPSDPVQTVQNSGGMIEALDGSFVRIPRNVTIEGGVISSSGSGAIRGSTPNQFGGGNGGTLSNVTNTGRVFIPKDEALTLAGTFTNNGLVQMDGTGGLAFLHLAHNTTINGTGVIQLSNDSGNRIMGLSDGATVTFGPGVTVQGGAYIPDPGNFGRRINLINQGLFDAHLPWAITIRPYGDIGAQVTNSGTLRARDGSALHINGVNSTVPNTLNNTGGTLEAFDGGQILLTNVSLTNYNGATQTLSGGTYRAVDGTLNLNTGAIVTNSADILLSGADSVFSAANSLRNNTGRFEIANGRNFTVGGELDNNGTFLVGPGSTLTVQGNVINDGTFVFRGMSGIAFPGAAPRVDYVAPEAPSAGSFINNGTLDIINAPGFTFPPGFVNNGVIIDAKAVKPQSVQRTVNSFTVTIASHTNHTYQLEKGSSPAAGSFAPIGDPQQGSTGVTLTFTDAEATAPRGFYRIAVN